MTARYLGFITIIFFLICFGLLLLLGVRGIVYSDEGYILYGAERILNGQIPYKDFHFVYTPFSLYATAVSFIIFGKNILAGRLLMIGVSLLSAWVLLLLLRNITKNVWMSLIGVLLYIIWAPLHANFPWPVLFAIPLGIISCYFLLVGEKSKSKNMVFFSGFFAFLVLFTKQNFGVAIGMSYIIAIYCIPGLRKRELLIAYFLGFFLPGIFYIFYLFLSGSFIAFFSDFYVYTLKRIVVEQTLTTPFILGESLAEKIGKCIFYTMPLLLGALASYVAFTRNKKYVFLSLFVCLYYLFGIRPTTDYIHLTPLLSIIGIPLVILWESINTTRIKIAIAGISILFIAIGLYSAFYRGYYKWEPPLIIQTNLLSVPKTYIYLDSFHKDQLERITTVITNNTKDSEQIFVNGYIPMLYFVTNRQNSTPFDLLEPTDFYDPYEKEIVAKLQKEKVRVVITRNDPGENYLGEFIKKEYNKTAKVNDFIIWEKKHL